VKPFVQRLKNAASRSSVEAFATLLNSDASFDAHTAQVEGVLLAAARNKACAGVLRLLVERGLDPSASCRFGSLPLLEAIDARNHAGVRALLELGADPNGVDNDGRTPCVLAVTREDVDALDLLLAAKCDVTAKTLWGETPLLLAVQRCHEGMVRRLLLAGADPNTSNNAGNRAIFCSAQSQCGVGIVRLLLDNGADVFAESAMPHVLLCTVASDAFKVLLAHLLRARGLQSSVDERALPALVASGLDLNAADLVMRRMVHTDVVALLFKAGAGKLCAGCENDVLEAAIVAGREESLAVCLAALGSDGRSLSHSLREVAPRVAALLGVCGVRLSSGDEQPFDDALASEATAQIVRVGFPLWRTRATEICISLQELELDALRLHLIVSECHPLAANHLPFHLMWRVVCAVRHFKHKTPHEV
jgi:ankyrin repeat protein